MKRFIYTGIIFLFIGFILFVHSCEKDPTIPEKSTADTSTYTPTPYDLKIPSTFPQMPTPDDNPLTEEGVKLGRHLFYDPILSIDSTLSCAGCHQQEAAFADKGKQYSETVNGQLTDRNAPAIINVGYMEKLFWDGRARSLTAQHKDALKGDMELQWRVALHRLRDHPRYPEMFHKAFPGETIGKEQTVKAIAQFVRTLVSGNSKYDRFVQGEATFTAAESRGFNLFFNETGDCFHCHGRPLMTDNLFRNTGLDSVPTYEDFEDLGVGGVTGDTLDYGKFKTPTLRNIEYTASYMHDGRFSTLKEVLDFYSDSVHWTPTIDPLMRPSDGGLQLTEQQKKDIIAYLKTLSDPSFVNDTSYSNPFQ